MTISSAFTLTESEEHLAELKDQLKNAYKMSESSLGSGSSSRQIKLRTIEELERQIKIVQNRIHLLKNIKSKQGAGIVQADFS